MSPWFGLWITAVIIGDETEKGYDISPVSLLHIKVWNSASYGRCAALRVVLLQHASKTVAGRNTANCCALPTWPCHAGLLWVVPLDWFTSGKRIHRNLQPTPGVIWAPRLFLKENKAAVSVGALLALWRSVFFGSEITVNSASPNVSAWFQLQTQSLEWLFMNNIELQIINLMSLTEEIF